MDGVLHLALGFAVRAANNSFIATPLSTFAQQLILHGNMV
jgi:hypothetical protein